MLYQNKEIDRMGKTEDGNLTSDYDPEEQRRHASLNASILPVLYKDIKVNVLDCPGSRDFVGQTKPCIRVADTMLAVIDATAGVEVGTELAFDAAVEYNKPVAIYVNKMDKENANFEKAIQEVQDAKGINVIPVCLPIGSEENFKGLVDLLRMKAVYAEPGKKPRIEAIPDDMADEAKAARAALVEAAAEGDETIMEKFLEDQPLSEEEVYTGLREVMVERTWIPALCGSATHCIGVDALLSFLEHCAPSPDNMAAFGAIKGDEEVELKYDDTTSLAAFVFHSVSDNFLGRVNFYKVINGTISGDSTVKNVNQNRDERISHLLSFIGKKSTNVDKFHAGDIGAVAKLDHTRSGDSLCDASSQYTFAPTELPKPTVMRAIVAKNKAEEEKLGMAINRISDTDDSLTIRRDPETHQTIMTGMGETHLEVALARLKAISKVDVELITPRVPYRETITKIAKGNYRHKKQSGGRGQFGEVFLRIEPNPDQEELNFAWEVVGGNIPTNFTSSVEKGVLTAMNRGILAGYKVVQIKVACFDGKHHPVDSSDNAFQMAASMGFKLIAQTANPIIMEPIMNLHVVAPDDNMGDVMGSISSKRGRPLGSESRGHKAMVEAQVPMSEMFDFSRELRSMTSGRGTFSMDFAHYERVTPEIQAKIIAEAEKAKEEEAH